MNLPNKLTIARIILVPLIILLMLPFSFAPAWNEFINSLTCQIIVLILFSIASATDWFDGNIARKRGLVTDFGKFLDPIADKLLILSVILVFVQRDRVHAFVLFIFLAREFTVTGLRLVAAEKQIVIAAGKTGKLKMGMQVAAIILMMLEPILGGFMADLEKPLAIAADVCLYISVILALVSGAEYMIKNKELISLKQS